MDCPNRAWTAIWNEKKSAEPLSETKKWLTKKFFQPKILKKKSFLSQFNRRWPIWKTREVAKNSLMASATMECMGWGQVRDTKGPFRQQKQQKISFLGPCQSWNRKKSIISSKNRHRIAKNQPIFKKMGFFWLFELKIATRHPEGLSSHSELKSP